MNLLFNLVFEFINFVCVHAHTCVCVCVGMLPCVYVYG